jgi:hypothetical protein
MLAHAQESADAQDDVRGLAGLVENNFVDVADLFVGLVVDVDADELGSAPFALPVLRGAALGRRSLVLGIRCPGDVVLR